MIVAEQFKLDRTNGVGLEDQAPIAAYTPHRIVEGFVAAVGLVPGRHIGTGPQRKEARVARVHGCRGRGNRKVGSRRREVRRVADSR